MTPHTSVKVSRMDDATLRRFADVIVGFGANVQPGQVVAVSCEPGKEYLVRAIAESAYRRGAKFVDVQWFDPWVKRTRVEFAREEDLDFIPDWHGKRLLALGEVGAARVGLSGPVAPGLMEDLDPARVGRDRFPALKEAGKVVNDRTTNWTIAPCPTPAWARLVYPDLPDEEALAKLEGNLMHVCRLDEEDPVAAWRERADFLVATADRLTQRGFDALHYEGPGTDFTVGLLRDARWAAARFERADGLVHMPNIPTEEVFTSPDPARVDGTVSAPWRDRAGRPRGPHRAARDRLLRHAAGRERREPHRARPGLPVPAGRQRQRRRCRRGQLVGDPHRLHDRVERPRGHRDHGGRRARARAPRRRLADLMVDPTTI
jgi:aminopeptidase